MPRISTILDTNESLYLFSDDLMWGCRFNALQAQKAENTYAQFLFRIACLLNGAALVEARLNELTAEVTGIEDSKPNIPMKFWKTLHEERKTLSFVTKWNLIASVSGGVIWDKGAEPFQSYDLVVCLRNELTHYKGEYGDNAVPPIRKLRALMEKLTGKKQRSTKESATEFWVNILLNEPKLANWILSSVEVIDMKFDHLLFGKKFTKYDEEIYKMKIAGLDPFRLSE